MALPSQRLDDVLRSLGSAAPPAISAHAETMLASLQPVRTSSPWRSLLAVGAASLGVAVIYVAWHGVRADVTRVSPLWLVSVGLGWAAGFAALLAVAILRRRGTMFPDPAWIAAAAVLGPVGMIALGASVGGVASARISPWDVELRQSATCLLAALEIGAAPFFAAAFALRRVQQVNPRAIGAVLGASGGALGALALHFRCASGGAFHVGLAHGGAALAGAIVGGLLLPRMGAR